MITRILPSFFLRAARGKFVLRSLGLAILALCLTAGSKKMDPTIAVRFHLQTNTFDPTFATKLMLGEPPREVLIEKIPTISERDIASFYPFSAADGTYAVAFQLDRHGQINLETLSASKRGTLLIAIINGRVITPLTIDKTITDGIIYVPSGLTVAEVRALGASFTIMGRENAPKPGKKPKPVDPEDVSPLAPR